MFQLEATAVHWACRGGSLAALQLLLDQGAKFTYRDKVGTHGLEEETGSCMLVLISTDLYRC